MAGRRRPKKQSSILLTVIVAAIFIFVFLCLCKLFGNLGAIIADFVTGLFGLSSFALVVALFVCFCLYKLRYTPSISKGALIRSLALYLLFVITLQVITTKNFLGNGVGYADYLSACYTEGYKSAGGAIAGVFAFPLMNYLGYVFALIILVIAFFAIMLSAIYPYFKGFIDKNERKGTRAEKPQKNKFERRRIPQNQMEIDLVNSNENSRATRRNRLFTTMIYTKDHDLVSNKKPLKYADVSMNFIAPFRKEDKQNGNLAHDVGANGKDGSVLDINRREDADIGSQTIILPPFTDDNSGGVTSSSMEEESRQSVPFGRTQKGRSRNPYNIDDLNSVENPQPVRTESSENRTITNSTSRGASTRDYNDKPRTITRKPVSNETYVRKSGAESSESSVFNDRVEDLSYGEFTYPYVKPDQTYLREYRNRMNNNEDYESEADRLEEVFSSLELPAKVVQIKAGPAYVQYAMKLDNQSQMKALNGIEQMLEYQLGSTFRYLKSVPKMPCTFAVELKNPNPSTVGLKEMMNSKSPDKLCEVRAAIGKSIDGEKIFADLGDIVHMLVAGSTGSGKSVFISSFILSLICDYGPDALRMIMVDPKVIELKSFNGLPHNLIKDAITEIPEAVKAVKWVASEMVRRYNVFDSIRGCKKIQDYNKKMQENGLPIMPYLLLVIDEFPSVFEDKKSGVDASVRSIVQKGRAAGIILLIACQRPTTDAVSGSTKAQIITRVALKVQNAIDSRAILEQSGAQGLIGNGDMLVNLPCVSNEPIRLQAPFVSSEELDDIVNDIIEHNPFTYDNSVEREVFSKGGAKMNVEGLNNDDELSEEDFMLMKRCLWLCICNNKCSATMLQSRFKIGYPKAASLIMYMADRGFISQPDSNNPSRPRTVLITDEQYIEEFGDPIE